MNPLLRACHIMLLSVLLIASGACGKAPPYAGEWVLDGSVDGKGVFTPAPVDEPRWALRFDPPATVSAGNADPKTGRLDPASLNTSYYKLFEQDKDVVQFGMFAAQVVEGHLMIGYPGDGQLRMSRQSGRRLFPKIRAIDLQRAVAEEAAADAEEQRKYEAADERMSAEP